MKNIIIFIIVLVFSFQLKAQSSIKPAITCDSSLTFVSQGKYRVCKIGNKVISLKEGYKRLSLSPASAAEFKKGQRVGRVGALLILGSLPTLAIPPVVGVPVFLGCLSVGIMEGAFSHHHLRKSIQLYNQSICNHRNA